ncbi:MAG TPA: hypothetical protein VF971_09385 [Candidatus Limnocylindrales bacterium]|jgi:hypothetical protein
MTTGTSQADRAAITALLRAGCTPAEATNLLGVSVGLRPVPAGWSLREIARLRFLRHLAETGRLSG